MCGGIRDFVLQEDNSVPQRASAVKSYSKVTGVLTIFWPAQSPELNAIGNTRAFIKDMFANPPDTPRTKSKYSTGLEKCGIELRRTTFKP